MTAVRDGLPEGRYGRSSNGRNDRGLKILGGVLGAVLLGVVVWSGVSYIGGEKVSGRVITWEGVPDGTVKVHLEVVKDRDATGVCTLRLLSKDKAEVGRKDVTVGGRGEQIDTEVTLRTTGKATAAELVGCTSAPSGGH
ncbi:DUF4307 domain-containing protein [Streptomyces catenulae]|uniref:DUF4307 domain-containing protein n=1 Tax=Streptomyces catenulae TaxID=66875 RepID=A0ABV2YTR2_9ACTN|nr:DUF4307 domain-containing protein [Streptomyces catenulae]